MPKRLYFDFGLIALQTNSKFLAVSGSMNMVPVVLPRENHISYCYDFSCIQLTFCGLIRDLLTSRSKPDTFDRGEVMI